MVSGQPQEGGFVLIGTGLDTAEGVADPSIPSMLDRQCVAPKQHVLGFGREHTG